MFFSIFLENNDLIEAPQIISWVGLILISRAIFSKLKINNNLAVLVLLCIGFSPKFYPYQQIILFFILGFPSLFFWIIFFKKNLNL